MISYPVLKFISRLYSCMVRLRIFFAGFGFFGNNFLTGDLDSISRDNIQLLVNRIFGLPVQHGDSGPCAILPTDSKVPGVEIPREKVWRTSIMKLRGNNLFCDRFNLFICMK